MKKNVSTLRVVGDDDATVLPALSAELQLAFADVAELAREGLLAMSVAVGLRVMNEMMQAEVTDRVGVKHAKLPDRTASRHSAAPGSVVLGGRRVPVTRPRARTIDGAEVQLATYATFSNDDLLNQVVMERMLAGVATRRHRAVGEPVGEQVTATATLDVALGGVAPVQDGDHQGAGRVDGPRPLRAAGGGDDDRRGLLRRAVLRGRAGDLRGRHQGPGRACGSVTPRTRPSSPTCSPTCRPAAWTRSGGILFVLDGSKALAAGVRKVFGDHALIQRCTLHKRRNVTDHLARDQRGWVDAKLAAAFNHPDPVAGLRAAKELAALLEDKHPDAAASLREGLDDMFTVRRLGLSDRLCRTLTNTNAIESMISVAKTTTRNVKRWRDGKMIKRWVAAGMLNAERSFRRLKGVKDMPALLAALARHAETVTPSCDNDEEKIA